MQERRIDALRHDGNYAAFDLLDGCERRRRLKVELLFGGFHIPGLIEYHARDGQVTFTRGYLRRIDCENGQERYTLCDDTTG